MTGVPGSRSTACVQIMSELEKMITREREGKAEEGVGRGWGWMEVEVRGEQGHSNVREEWDDWRHQAAASFVRCRAVPVL